MDADVIVVGAGLAGSGRHPRADPPRQEGRPGRPGERGQPGRAGLLVVRRAVPGRHPRTARLGIKDSFELAWNDWPGSAAFDRLDDEDRWAARWARAYVEFAAGEKRSYLAEHGIKFLPDRRLGRARRPARRRARQLGAALPRRLGHRHRRRRAVCRLGSGRPPTRGLVTFHHRHRVDELVFDRRRGHRVRGHAAGPRRRARAARRPTATWSASSSCPRRP